MTAVRAESKGAADERRKAYRWRLQDTIGNMLPSERVNQCCRRALASHVDVRGGESGASFGGLVTCSSVWACPICAPKIQRPRADEVGQLIRAHLAGGGQVHMCALTLRHNAGQPCKALRTAVTDVWQQVRGTRAYERAAAEAGLVGYVKAFEITYGENGWHPHLHILFFFSSGSREEKIEAFGFAVFEQWAKRMDKRGFGPCNPSVFQFEPAHTTERAGDYVTKWGSEWEIVSGHTKQGKAGGLSPWQIAERAGKGSKRHRLLFREYYAAFKGARQLTYSKGLRELYGLRQAASDVDLNADSVEEARPLLGKLPRHVFWKIRARGLTAAFDAAIRRRPVWTDILIWLREHGIDAFEPPPDKSAYAKGGAIYSGPLEGTRLRGAIERAGSAYGLARCDFGSRSAAVNSGGLTP